MAKTGRNRPRTSGKRKGEASALEKAAANLMLFAIPGVGTVRAAVTAGKVAPRILQMVRQLGGKKIAKPTTTQIKNAKPTSALRQKAGEIKVGSRTATKKTTASAAGTRAKSSAKTKVKADRKPVKAQTKVVGQANRAKSQGGRTFAQTKKAPKKPAAAKKSALTTADKLLIGAVGLGAGTAAVTSKGPKKSKAATVATPTSRPKRPTKRTGMSEGNTVAGSSGRDPRTRNAPNVGLGKMPKKAAAKKVPSTKSRDKDGEGTGKINLPAGAKRKFQGSYNKKTEKLRNIGGKTYVFNK